MSEFLQSWFRRPTLAARLARFGLRPDVLAAAQLMVTDRRSDPQIVALGASLTDAETVLRMIDGRHRHDRGLLVLTDQRVFFRSRRSDGPVAFSVPLTQIDSIEGSTHKVVGTVSVHCADGHFIVDDILGIQGETLAQAAVDAQHGAVSPQRDPLEVLGELRALRDSGEISAAEFEARKSDLWEGI